MSSDCREPTHEEGPGRVSFVSGEAGPPRRSAGQSSRSLSIIAARLVDASRVAVVVGPARHGGHRGSSLLRSG